MRWTRPKPIGSSIEVKAANRPVKIAYVVPVDDSPTSHQILDAVIFESYTRWGGAFTLFIPGSTTSFVSEQFAEWLTHFDPDFIYSYVDLDAELIDKIDRLACPIAFLSHQIRRSRESGELTWRAYLPDFHHYIHPISSITAVSSPAARIKAPHQQDIDEPVIFTQYGMEPTDRFLADNFGTGFDLRNVTHAVPGLFKTLCLVREGLPENFVAGSHRCHSRLDAFRAIADRKAIPIARLAMANSAGIVRARSHEWEYAFRIFVGTSPMDRINFWHCRHLGGNEIDSINALIVEESFFEDELLVKQLGEYLNKHNFFGHGGGQYIVELHSTSVSAESLRACASKLKLRTWNMVHVASNVSAIVAPTKKKLSEGRFERNNDAVTFKVTDDYSEVTAREPAHFIYLPPQLRWIARGQWVVECSIQRHNNLSKYSNVTDLWDLPRKKRVTRAFTDRLAKPTLSGRLALIPSTENFPFDTHSTLASYSFDLALPHDESLFRWITLDIFRYPDDDLRKDSALTGFQSLDISDKGKNLRGTISLFDDLPTAYEILTKSYWREVFASANEDSVRPLTFDLNKLASLIPNDQPTIRRLTDELRLEGEGTTKNYLKDGLIDTLEYLVRIGVFHSIAAWRCEYCGHQNARNFDNAKLKNECDVCQTVFSVPIDFQWQYALNQFVYRSLHKHAGLSVLWALGYLQDRLTDGAFCYLPEVNLYEDYDDPNSNLEIDILCMLGRKFCVGEAKRSASLFLNRDGEAEKFKKIVNRLRPDIALLAFERYSAQKENRDEIKARLSAVIANLRQELGPWVRLEVIVAEEMKDFSEFAGDFGWVGPRLRRYR